MLSTLSIYGSHDASVTFVDKNDEIKVLEYERFVNQRYGAFTQRMDHRNGLGSNDEKRNLFFQHIKKQVKKDIDLVIHNEISSGDMEFISNHFPNAQFKKMEHHRSHAASGFFQSGFEKAVIFSIDGGGNDYDGVTYTASYLAEGDNVELIKKYDINLGVAYGHIGCPISEIKPGPDSDRHSLVYAGKVMGLCAYGNVIEDWIEPMAKYYNHKHLSQLGNEIGLDLTLNSIEGQSSYDLAATSQYVFEELSLQLITPLIDEHEEHDVILVGGCALNVLFNQRLYEHLDKSGRKLYVPPNPNDCGLSLGQFLLEYPQQVNDIHYNGFELLDYDKLESHVKERGARKIDVSEIVTLLKSGKLIGLVEGCSEIGPRALGNRSIICDPSFPNMKDILNSKVKFREWYRPFAPVARLENASEYFNDVFESKYMSYAPTVKEEYEEELKAITHIDKTSRLQTVTEKQHKRFYDILKELENQGHVSVILNTSFNILGNPILTKVEDALYVLDNTELDYVIVDDYLFGEKNE
jgi:carbamoyltransferase|tara:strand:- start:1158 stop:2729 length:1572 start_codon:yes stop_codon:yes gene_type:complete